MERLCWQPFCGQLVFWTTALFMRRSQSPFGRRVMNRAAGGPSILLKSRMCGRATMAESNLDELAINLISAKGS